MKFECFLCYIFGYLFVKVESSLPELKSNNTQDVILTPGSNYKIKCSGDEPLQWHYPEIDQQGYNWTNISIYNLKSNQSPYYVSTLSITNISYPFVGYYNCLYANSNIINQQIYLYVNDSNHLSPIQSNDYYTHYAVQFKPSVIKLCRPTVPGINVRILTREKKKLPFNVTSLDPHEGLSISGSNYLMTGRTYKCIFERGNVTEIRQFIMIVEEPRNTIAKPYIEDISQNHTEIGQNFTLNCYLQEESTIIEFIWKTPRGNIRNYAIRKEINGKQFLVSTLYLNNTNLMDSGEYECHVKDTQNHENSCITYVKIHDSDVCFIKIDQTSDQQRNQTASAGKTVQWILNFISHPEPQLTWLFKKNVIEDGRKYSIKNQTKNTYTFAIHNLSLNDDGVYTVKAQSFRENRICSNLTVDLQLIVKDKPSVILEPQEVYITSNNKTKKEIKCTATGNPMPEIQWEYEKCLNRKKCDIFKRRIKNEVIIGKYEKLSKFPLHVVAGNEGIVRCLAKSSLGTSSSAAQYYTSEIENGFAIFNYGDNAIVEKTSENNMTTITVAKGYELTFTCAVSLNKSKVLSIKYNNSAIENFKSYHIINDNNGITMNSTISLITAAETKDSGMYTCEIIDKKTGYIEYEHVIFHVTERQLPRIRATNLFNNVKVDYPKMPYKLYCNYSGVPKVNVKWYKDNILIKPSSRILIENNGATLNFLETKITDEGQYLCNVSNKLGSVYKSAILEFKDKPVSTLAYVVLIVLIGLLLIMALVYIIIKKRKEETLKRELKALGLENFHKGNPENLNPDLSIDDQAELLPYNKKWEFPIEQLKLGKQLGSGAFGVVLKAEARKLIDGEETTIVAVKMVKKNADHSYIKALVSELKILIHVGQHINVVNLLGACTKNVTKKELLMIVEFCQYGNLQNYLLRNRGTFINQIDMKSGRIDYAIGGVYFSGKTCPPANDQGNKSHNNNSMQDYRENINSGTKLINPVLKSDGTDDSAALNSNNSNQPEWRTNYRGDYKGDTIRPVSTKDLITWSFQIARGMEYLASRKVLHGDLAARNVLLADNNVVKICDFGLAKTMFNDSNYQKKTNSPLPIKWMAIESIRDKVFSTHSDVWAFGIVLWELFSLGRTPYPGIEADERLYYKLIDGYRMESPAYAPKQMYALMMDCWAAKPLTRPSFTGLTKTIGYLLEESVRKHYIDINDPYLAINTEKFEENDYLAMLCPPSFATSPSHYQNEDALALGASANSSEGYTLMETNRIFSPRLRQENAFDFNVERCDNAEMMADSKNSDTESGYLSPLPPLNSISNLNYYQSSNPIVNLSKIDDNLVDNYVTMPKYCNYPNNISDKQPEQPLKSKCKKAVIAHYINGNVLLNNEIRN